MEATVETRDSQRGRRKGNFQVKEEGGLLSPVLSNNSSSL
jgi:hypothetical protein